MPYTNERVREIAEELAKRDGPLLPILHEIQTAFGYIPDDAVIIVADVLNLTRAEVHGTVTFYHDFRTTPPAPTIVKLCRAEACQAMGVNALAAELETLVDNQTSLEKTYCLGLCATAPAAMVNDQVHGRLTAKRLHRLIEAAK